MRPKREGRSKGSRAMAIDDEAGRTDRLRVGSLTFEYENGSRIITCAYVKAQRSCLCRSRFQNNHRRMPIRKVRNTTTFNRSAIRAVSSGLLLPLQRGLSDAPRSNTRSVTSSAEPSKRLTTLPTEASKSICRRREPPGSCKRKAEKMTQIKPMARQIPSRKVNKTRRG